MALKLKKTTGKATITNQKKDGPTVVAEDVTEEQVETPGTELSVDPSCEVGVEMSYTHNLGDYKSARVQVSLKVPCAHPEVDDVYDYARTWVDEKLNSLIEDITS